MWRVALCSIRAAKAQKHCGERRTYAGISAPVGERSLALRMEYRIKQLTKRQKERLVAGDGIFEALLEGLVTAAD
jgi:putative endonuclease